MSHLHVFLFIDHAVARRLLSASSKRLTHASMVNSHEKPARAAPLAALRCSGWLREAKVTRLVIVKGFIKGVI